MCPGLLSCYVVFSATFEFFCCIPPYRGAMRTKKLRRTTDLRCCRCKQIVADAAALQCHEASCYETPPPRKRTRRWNISLSCWRWKSYHEVSRYETPPPCKRTRRWSIPLTCSAPPSVSLVARADAHYRVQPVGRWQPLARQCSEKEAHERYEHQMIAFFRLSGGLTEDMKHEPWYIRGLKAEPHDR